MVKVSDGTRTYQLGKAPTADDVINTAAAILTDRFAPGEFMSSPETCQAHLRMRLGNLEREAFHVLLLDARHRIIREETMFLGTLTQAEVHPREVVRAALLHNAAAIICAHNHPSGDPEPSPADKALTNRLQLSLGLIDVKLLDHIVVGRGGTVSFAARGLI